jgi:hypothetical protein
MHRRAVLMVPKASVHIHVRRGRIGPGITQRRRGRPCRSESACRRSLQPLSPIQNNSDLAQGPLPIRPSKVRRSDIYLAPGGVHGTETKTS